MITKDKFNNTYGSFLDYLDESNRLPVELEDLFNFYIKSKIDTDEKCEYASKELDKIFKKLNLEKEFKKFKSEDFSNKNNIHYSVNIKLNSNAVFKIVSYYIGDEPERVCLYICNSTARNPVNDSFICKLPKFLTKEDAESILQNLVDSINNILPKELNNMSNIKIMKNVNYSKLIADKAKHINFSEVNEEKKTNSEADDLKRQILASVKDYIKSETGKDVFLDSDKFDRFFEDMLWDAKHGKFNKSEDFLKNFSSEGIYKVYKNGKVINTYNLKDFNSIDELEGAISEDYFNPFDRKRGFAFDKVELPDGNVFTAEYWKERDYKKGEERYNQQRWMQKSESIRKTPPKLVDDNKPIIKYKIYIDGEVDDVFDSRDYYNIKHVENAIHDAYINDDGTELLFDKVVLSNGKVYDSKSFLEKVNSN